MPGCVLTNSTNILLCVGRMQESTLILKAFKIPHEQGVDVTASIPDQASELPFAWGTARSALARWPTKSKSLVFEWDQNCQRTALFRKSRKAGHALQDFRTNNDLTAAHPLTKDRGMATIFEFSFAGHAIPCLADSRMSE